ncbi:MAG: hypothetical protein ACI4K7_03620 [Oscillospiraceae bacterium]
MMIKFETIKELVTVRQAAEHYGLNVNRSNMCRCPFHSDHTPSMKIYERTALRKEVKHIERRMYEYRRSLITLVTGGLRSAGRTAVLQ